MIPRDLVFSCGITLTHTFTVGSPDLKADKELIITDYLFYNPVNVYTGQFPCVDSLNKWLNCIYMPLVLILS